jgi:[calcium/calmodulin-dependent protein kinase] kinase
MVENAVDTSDYFAPKPCRYQPTVLTSPTDNSTGADHPPLELKASNTASPAPPEQTNIDVEYQSLTAVQQDLSDTFATSTNTTQDSGFVPLLTSSHHPREYPQFPNQAHSALHSQHHPPPYLPKYKLRHQKSNPSPHLSYSQHAQLDTPVHTDDPRSTTESGSRTAGNSPANSPGLFTPTTSPLRPEFTESESLAGYSSPYLHFTQRQMPKETHLAEIDRDPISGRKLINQYEVIDELGRGMHGKVKLGRNLETGQYVAIKIVERYSKRPRLGKSGSHEEKIKREIAILKKARHPNIVGLLEVIDDPDVKKVYIVLEHVEMGEVRWRIEGQREICLVEWRRYKREAHGIVDNESAQMEDELILQEARRLRDRAERRRWRKFLRQQSEGTGAEPWSLEHGGDAEYDFYSDRVSRSSTLTDEANTGSQKSETHQSVTHDRADPVFETSIHDDQRRERQLQGTETYHQQPSPQPSEHAEICQETGLEGTMYGAYDFDPPRGRTPSVAGSAESLRNFEQEEDEIPDHFRYVPLMTLGAARDAFRDTVLGLEFLHYQGVVHRDIKPANLLQSADHHIKISDFGVSYLGRETRTQVEGDQSESEAPDPDDAVELAKTVGTPAFYAPELCQTDPDEDAPPVTGQIDIWALGVTLYCLVFGRVPFHDNNTFVLMRRIAEENVYIPRHRLKAVDELAGSRPSSHGRYYKPINSNKRLPHELDTEEIDDDLYDLLRRLLEKDPRKRIKLIEVKRHPWVLKDLGIDNLRWLDETDPSRQTQGQKIEISKEDVDVAVVPFTMFDRVRDTFRKVTGALGMNRPSSRRSRAKSTVTNKDNQPSSAGSSSSTISQDARRQEKRRLSLKPEESIFSASKASREGEHPLSQSVTASPETKEELQFFTGTSSRPESPSPLPEASQFEREKSASHRSLGLERAISATSAADSVRTIKQADMSNLASSGSSTFSTLPNTPMLVDTTSASNVSGIFDGAKKIIRNVRSRERRGHRDREHSIESANTDDMHAEPSIGFSNVVAAGHVNLPAFFKEGSTGGSSGIPSPASSRAQSLSSASHDRLNTAIHSDHSDLSRQSSVASVTSHPRSALSVSSVDGFLPQANFLPLTADATEGQYSKPNPITRSTTDIRFRKAQDELVMRRELEEQQNRDRPSSSLSQRRPRSALSQSACPPSPDDDIFIQQQQQEVQQRLYTNICHMNSLPEAEPAVFNAEQLEKPHIVSSSSEDHFPSAMSQSTSNPSIPSVVSADSSIPPDDGVYTLGSDNKTQTVRSDDNATELFSQQHHDDYEGYAGDGDAAVDSDSDDSFIEMSRQKPRANPQNCSQGTSNGDLGLHRNKKASGKVRAARSGSNNTTKRIDSHDETDLDEADGNRH